MSFGGALVIFVKTPELSPVKTRLASTIGMENSHKFYELSLKATFALAQKAKEELPSLQVYWAVSEREGLCAERWNSLPVVFQGEGELGARLDLVYRELLQQHHFVCFIGADSPHLRLGDLKQGVLATAKNLGEKFVIGETIDGGFYFFGGSVPLPSEVWLNVEYSSSRTAEQLISKLLEIGQIDFLGKNFDIDTEEDLRRLKSAIFSHGDELLQEQIDLIKWISTSV